VYIIMLPCVADADIIFLSCFFLLLLLPRSFVCRGCSNPVVSIGHTTVDIGAGANLEIVDEFCYLGPG